MCARLAHFYGWSDKDIRAMSYERAVMYYKSITIIDANNVMRDLKTADFPHIKTASRNKYFREIRRMSTAELERSSEPVSTRQIAEKLAGRALGG